MYTEVFCPRLASQSREAYLKEQYIACSSPEAMLDAMTRRVSPGVKVQQPATAASYANLLWNLMRNDVQQGKERLTEKECRLHPVLTHLTLSKEQLDSVAGGGLLIGGKSGPPGSPWEIQRIPEWKLAVEGSWGIGVCAQEDLSAGQFAGLYMGLAVKSFQGFPAGRHNVSLDKSSLCLGELPMKVLLHYGASGAFINAAAPADAELELRRQDAWEWRGLIFIPLYVKSGKLIRVGQFVHWHYNWKSGAGGADSFSFDDSLFHPQAAATP